MSQLFLILWNILLVVLHILFNYASISSHLALSHDVAKL